MLAQRKGQCNELVLLLCLFILLVSVEMVMVVEKVELNTILGRKVLEEKAELLF